MPGQNLFLLPDSSDATNSGDSISGWHFGIFKNIAEVKVPEYKYVQIYKGHELRPVNHYAQLRKDVSPDWFFPFLLVTLAIFTWLRIFYSKYFTQMIQALVNVNLANQMVRDENILVQRASVYMSIVFNLILALFLYLVSVHYRWSLGGIDNGFGRFMFFVVIVTAVYSLKFLILKICGWLFRQEREMATYMFYTFLVNNILGIIFLPFICIIAYNQYLPSSALIVIAVVLAAIGFGWRIFRGIQISLGAASFSPLYLFLYLCTLEIAPLMVLVRIIVQ